MQTTGTCLKRFGFVLFINVLFIKLYLGLDQHFHTKDSFSGMWNMFLPGANNILPWLKLSIEISSTKRRFFSCLLLFERQDTLIFLLLICSVHFQIFNFVSTIRTCFDGQTFSSVFLIIHSRDHIQQAIYIPYFTIDFIRMGLYLIDFPIYFTKN